MLVRIRSVLGWALSVLWLAGCQPSTPPNVAGPKSVPTVEQAAPSTRSARAPAATRGADPVEADVRQTTGYHRKFAILIGIDNYDRSANGLDPLGNAVNDARETAAILREEFSYEAGQIHFLVDQQATRQALTTELQAWLAQQSLTADDSLLFFFAGHGLVDAKTGDGYLAVIDSSARDFQTCVPVSGIRESLAALPCRHRVVILDSCYSGRLFQPRQGATRTADHESNELPPSDRPTANGRGASTEMANDRGASSSRHGPASSDRILTSNLVVPAFLGLSAGRDTPVADGLGADRHSIFTSALLQVLRERANSVRDDHAFTFTQLAVQVSERVGNALGTAQVPDWGVLDEAATGDFLFVPTFRRQTPREISEERRRTSHQRMIQMYLTSGWREFEASNYVLSFPWFAQPIIEDSDDGDRLAIHQRRLASVLGSVSRLEWMWHAVGPIWDIEFSPDGARLAAACSDGKVRVWTVSAPQSAEPVLVIDCGQSVHRVAFHDNGSELITASTSQNRDQGGVRFWNAVNGEPLEAYNPGSATTGARRTPDGRFLWVLVPRQIGGRVSEPQVLDLKTKQPVKIARENEYPRSLAVSQNGLRGAFTIQAREGHIIRVWDAVQADFFGEPIATGFDDVPAALSADGVLVATIDAEGGVQVREVESGQLIGPRLARDAKAIGLEFSPQPGRLLTLHERRLSVQTGAETETAYALVWDYLSGEPTTGPLRHADHVIEATFSPRGNAVVTLDEREARLWFSESGDAFGDMLLHRSGITDAAISPDRKVIATCGREGTIRLWSPPAGDLEHVFEPEDNTEAEHTGERLPIFLADGTRLAVFSFWRLHMYDAKTRERLFVIPEKGRTVVFARFTIDGQRIVTVEDQYIHPNSALVVNQWNAHTGELLAAPQELARTQDTFRPTAFAIDPAGKYAISTHVNGSIGLWSLGGDDPPRLVPYDSPANDAVFDPRGRWVAVAHGADSQAGQVLLRSIGSGQVLRKFDLPQGASRIAVSPDGSQLAAACGSQFGPTGNEVGSAGQVLIWNANTGEQVAGPLLHAGFVLALSFSPDGTRLATGSRDNQARVWSASTGRPISRAMSHDADVLSVTFDATGRMLATACGDPPPAWRTGEARVWDVETGMPVSDAWRFSEAASGVSFSPDSQLVAVGCEAGSESVNLFRLPIDFRSPQALAASARLIAEAKIDENGDLVPLTRTEILEAWRQMQEK